MSLDVAPIEPTGFETAPQRAPRDARAADAFGGADALDLSTGEIPASPPAEVLEAMSAAGRVAHELHAQGRELRFVTPEQSGGDDGRVRIEVTNLDGDVLRTIPPSEALDVATGSPLG